jgi:hypothetical protein
MDVTRNGPALPFPSPRGRCLDDEACAEPGMKRLTKSVGIEDATAHDSRRTGTTNITSERIAIPRFVVSRVLNHINTGDSAVVTGVYDRNAYLAEKRRALMAWAALLQEIVEKRQPGSLAATQGKVASDRERGRASQRRSFMVRET